MWVCCIPDAFPYASLGVALTLMKEKMTKLFPAFQYPPPTPVRISRDPPDVN